MTLIPATAIIPTLNRRDRLVRTLSSLFHQSVVPVEVIVIDASRVCCTPAELPSAPAGVRVICRPATQRGAACQRNQAQALASQPYLYFLDDDVDLEPGCSETLWGTLQRDAQLGGCGAVITNQHYIPPGRLMRRIYSLLGCPAVGSLAGRCTGPALNFLPALTSPTQTPAPGADWLNLCCTLFRRDVLPVPALLPFFHGYSLMEDAALTMHVARTWRLAAPPAARVYHDSQPAGYKDRAYAREKMETINRWYVMRCIMGRDSLVWDLRQVAFQLLMLLIPLLHPRAWRRQLQALAGKISGLSTVLLHGHRWRGYNPLPPA